MRGSAALSLWAMLALGGPPAVTALPNSLLFTDETGTTTTFNITFNQAAPGGGSTVTVTVNDPTEGQVSSATNPAPASVIVINVAPGFTGSIPITVTGFDDPIVDGPQPYTISVTATNMGVAIPDVNVTNNDNDVAGVTFSRLSGLITDESGGSDSFTVVLDTQPFGFIDLPISSSNTLEMTVSPTTLRFTPSGNPTYNPATGVGDWNVPHIVTVTGVDDAVVDSWVPFSVVTGTLVLSSASDNPAYNFDPADVTGLNFDNEPVSITVGGCGLLGPDLLLPFAILALWRRRRR